MSNVASVFTSGNHTTSPSPRTAGLSCVHRLVIDALVLRRAMQSHRIPLY